MGTRSFPETRHRTRGSTTKRIFLSISTAQLERYMSVARKITRLATGLPPTGGSEIFTVPLLLRQDDRQSEDLPLGSRGGVAIRHYFPVDGEYLIKVRLGTNWQAYIRGMGRQHQLEVRIDGELVKRFTVGGEARGRAAPNTYSIAELGDPRLGGVPPHGRRWVGSPPAGHGGTAPDRRVLHEEDVGAGRHPAAGI